MTVIMISYASYLLVGIRCEALALRPVGNDTYDRGLTLVKPSLNELQIARFIELTVRLKRIRFEIERAIC